MYNLIHTLRRHTPLHIFIVVVLRSVLSLMLLLHAAAVQRSVASDTVAFAACELRQLLLLLLNVVMVD
jgi:hypothetical protein